MNETSEKSERTSTVNQSVRSINKLISQPRREPSKAPAAFIRAPQQARRGITACGFKTDPFQWNFRKLKNKIKKYFIWIFIEKQTPAAIYCSSESRLTVFSVLVTEQWTPTETSNLTKHFLEWKISSQFHLWASTSALQLLNNEWGAVICSAGAIWRMSCSTLFLTQGCRVLAGRVYTVAAELLKGESADAAASSMKSDCKMYNSMRELILEELNFF